MLLQVVVVPMALVAERTLDRIVTENDIEYLTGHRIFLSYPKWTFKTCL